ncbi:MAG: aminotransferase class V-fold PLP-dependent enzyme [Candidatus Micrarchaeota archaeon]|nr:aminotransferase class V-fold PLP-dependent enzyme [Candidatus Micrarchaeota archaeon]
MDFEKLRQDFPLLKNKIIYFDSACTSLKPVQVIEAERRYYEEISACAGRSAHLLAKRASEMFEGARERVAKFIGSKPNEVVFTKNATEALNLVVRSLDYSKRSKIVTTKLEHHSLLLPIIEQQRRGAARVEFLPATTSGLVDEASVEMAIDRQTALVAIHHTTNTTGVRAPLEKIVKVAHENGAYVLVDGAQGVPHSQVNFRSLGADFLAFSGHKMLGPTGIGCLVGREEALKELDTFIVGGETAESVRLDGVKFLEPPKKFEGGIQNYAGAAGLAAACEYLSKIGMGRVEEHEKRLAWKLIEAIGSIEGATLYGPKTAEKRCALACFNLGGVKHHQVALMCDSLAKIALRSGFFCAQPAVELMGAAEGAVRASLYIYNTPAEIEAFKETLGKIAMLGR